MVEKGKSSGFPRVLHFFSNPEIVFTGYKNQIIPNFKDVKMHVCLVQNNYMYLRGGEGSTIRKPTGFEGLHVYRWGLRGSVPRERPAPHTGELDSDHFPAQVSWKRAPDHPRPWEGR